MTANVLPPPHDLELPIVKLLSHPTYQSYQSHIATLSLFPRVYLSYVPPTWNAPTPPTPLLEQNATASSKEKKEWKRRIKMYCKSLLARSLVSPSSVDFWSYFVLQWVLPLKRSGLHASCMAQGHLRFPMHARMRAIGTRLRVKHSRSLALTRRASMLSLAATHNIYMWPRQDVLLKSVFID
jgi:hypothetical protein